MPFCLTKSLTTEFLKRVKSGEVDPEKLSNMTSQERRTFFTTFLGDENARHINALFESKLLLKNQQQGIITWAKKIGGLKPQAQRDILSRVERMTEILQPKEMDAFLEDLASQRLGVSVSLDEAGKIAELSKTITDKKSIIPENSPIRSPERMEYGTALALFKQYVGGLKAQAKQLTPKELLSNPIQLLQEIGGATKSIASAFDNSFFGRQGLLTLITKPNIWGNNFIKSWGDMKKELKGIDAMIPIQADVFSRPNAMNGKYKALKLDIGLESEEAFPSSWPEKIPFFGKIFKASESAYNGAALRFRADLADRLIPEIEASGTDLKSSGLGILINSMTGRGRVELTPGQSKFINTTIYSIKWLKSNLDVLTAHQFDPNVSPVVKKKAAENLGRMVLTIGSLLGVAKMIDPESVEEDPRSFNFGKIMVGPNHEFKISVLPGFGALITLASRVVPTLHNGELGFWYKTTKGKYFKLSTGKFGSKTPTDMIVDFMEGKAAPVARTLLTVWEGRTFEGEEPTLTGEARKLATPIPIENLFEIAQFSTGANPILVAILSGLELIGFNVGTPTKRRK